MNVVLSPEEILHVLQTVLKSPMHDTREQDALVSKLKKPILNVLEKEEVRLKDVAFSAWSDLEEKKIEDLKQKNAEIKTPLKTARKK